MPTVCYPPFQKNTYSACMLSPLDGRVSLATIFQGKLRQATAKLEYSSLDKYTFQNNVSGHHRWAMIARSLIANLWQQRSAYSQYTEKRCNANDSEIQFSFN